MSRLARHMVGVAAFALFLSTAHSVFATAANPLQSAYWRFEEGPVDQPVTPGDNDYVKDSINSNHMRAFDGGTTPDYTADVAPTPLKSGNANTLALNFSVHDDLYADAATTPKKINNGIIGTTVAPDVHGFTIEAAFKPSAILPTFQAIIGKEGKPSSTSINETLELKIRGDNDKLQFEQFDLAGNQVQVSSLNTMNVGQWYYAAVVNDGSNMSMYLDSNDGNGYVLQGTTAVSGALYQGPNQNDWDHTWSIGRGFNYATHPEPDKGDPADWFNGVIDEVRLSNSALAPSDFLFAASTFPGDYNGDKIVDAGDYDVWRKTNVLGADGYTAWRNNFGKNYNSTGSGTVAASVPEPASLMIAAIAFAGVAAVRRRNRQ